MLGFMKKSVRSDFYYRLLMLYDKKAHRGFFILKMTFFQFLSKILTSRKKCGIIFMSIVELLIFDIVRGLKAL